MVCISRTQPTLTDVRPGAESIFSGYTGRSTRSAGSSVGSNASSTTSSTKVIQPLGPRSFVTRSTEVTISSQDGMNITNQSQTIVSISTSDATPIDTQDLSNEL
jgi:hypothetical protein